MGWILLSLFLSGPADAGLLEQCRAWFARASTPAIAPFSAEERLVWERAFGPGGTHPALSARQMDSALFWHAYGKLPEAVRSRIESLPLDSRLHHRHLESWAGSSDSSFLRQILRELDRERPAQESVADYLRKNLAAHREKLAREPALGRRLDERFSFARRVSFAESAWIREAGVVRIPVVERNGKRYLRIGGVEFEAELRKGEWIVRVPKDRVAHPSWNPVSREKLMAMATAGVEAPRSYPTSLGHDGLFYLLDGNHRFELDARGMLRVRIFDPPATTNLRGMFDLLNLPQPSETQILDFHEGRIDWRALLPRAEDAAHFPLLSPR